MYIEDFPSCCGAYILASFRGHPPQRCNPYTEEQAKDIREFLKLKKRNEGPNGLYDEPRGCLMLILNTFQEVKFGWVVRDEGFRMVNRWVNPPEYTELFLYVYNLHNFNKISDVSKDRTLKVSEDVGLRKDGKLVHQFR